MKFDQNDFFAVSGYYTEKIGAAKMLQNLKASVTSGGAVTGGAGGGGVVSGTVDHHPLSPTNAPINPLSATQVDNRYAHYRKRLCQNGIDLVFGWGIKYW